MSITPVGQKRSRELLPVKLTRTEWAVVISAMSSYGELAPIFDELKSDIIEQAGLPKLEPVGVPDGVAKGEVES